MNLPPKNTVLRLGIDSPRRCILKMGVPLLVSANSLWDEKRKRFRNCSVYQKNDVALDSSGFVAMKLYGGYRWTTQDYAELALNMKPVWWAQMDFCCEPEIAASRSEIESRIQRTIEGLNDCRSAARSLGIPDPMPVLQGFEPSDYVSGPIFQNKFPDLVGIGSVCRRHLKGKNGLMAVFDAVNTALPNHVAIHLFGVKGTALCEIVKTFSHRKISSDSMAYQYAARWEAFKSKTPKNSEMIYRHAVKWLNDNKTFESEQLNLF